MSKLHESRIHARDRALERYGVTLTAEDIHGFEARIRKGGDDTCVPLAFMRDNRSRSLHAIMVGARWLPAIYDSKSRSVVTFLDRRMIKRFRGLLGAEPEGDSLDPEPNPLAGLRVPKLPPDPDEPLDGATPTEIEQARQAVLLRQTAVLAVLSILTQDDPRCAGMREELARLEERHRVLKKRRHLAFDRCWHLSHVPEDPTNAVDALKMAYRSLRTMMGRLCGHLTDHERAAMHAAERFLEATGGLGMAGRQGQGE